MFNFGFTELFALAVLALLVIGPKQLPELARNIAKLLNEFKRMTGQITDPFQKTQNKINNFDNQAKDFLQRAEENVEGYVREPDPGERLDLHEPETNNETQVSENPKKSGEGTLKDES